ncbi:MAG: 3'-5' exonuclease domain-containing protein 2 [Magnetococcales bacterium]|nr:3'-5' exonuclease domain-containing protein 2 [Magnetococcales bacterium]MBF0156374.1 3'-5' exonuclease domain-containing protein 2 [Magnetococcales bacterium]
MARVGPEGSEPGRGRREGSGGEGNSPSAVGGEGLSLPAEYAAKLSKDEINRLPIRRWEGPVQVIEDEAGMERALRELVRERILGFDTETKPVFKKGVTHPPALVQLATASTVYLFRLGHLTDHSGLSCLLEDAGVLKVGVGLGEDAKRLRDVFSFEINGMVDLGEAACRVGLASRGLRSLAATFFRCRISKRAQCSNWESRELKPFQITYAATDAWISRELFLFMQGLGLFDPDPLVGGRCAS